jgi:phenolic acid decarboxylase
MSSINILQMKIGFRILLMILLISSCTSKKKLMNNGLPAIIATKKNIDYKIGDNWVYGRWSIAPEVENDTLTIICYRPKEAFKFRTNVDSIELEIEPEKSKSFYVILNDSLFAHTIIHGVSFSPNRISYDSVNKSEINITYQSDLNEYLSTLKNEYPLNFITNDMSDKEAVLAALNWTNNRWQHDGNNSPKKNDAISILNEAKEGSKFPCFAYAIVLRDQLNAIGYKARTVYLKTQDAEFRKSSPGHVATEVYLNDLNKWVFIDAQFNVMPTLNGTPLNAIEFQNDINNDYEDFKLVSLGNGIISKRNYVKFVYDYLFYIDTALDNRYNNSEKFKIGGKRSVMLVPIGAKNISHINFWNMDVDYCVYTNSIKDFYSTPN